MGYLLVESVHNIWFGTASTSPSHKTLFIGLGSMALGLIPMTYYWLKKTPYFEMVAKEDRHAAVIEIVKEIEEHL
jgi:hypothetical protein